MGLGSEYALASREAISIFALPAQLLLDLDVFRANRARHRVDAHSWDRRSTRQGAAASGRPALKEPRSREGRS